MSALKSITNAIAREKETKPWIAFCNQNQGVAPAVISYLSGGPRPTDAQLGGNKYALARRETEDARRALDVSMPAIPDVLKNGTVVSVPGVVENGRTEVVFIKP